MLIKSEMVRGSCGIAHKDILEWKHCKFCEKKDKERSRTNKFSRESFSGDGYIKLKAYRVIENCPRVNTMTIKNVENNYIMIFIDNGHNKDTGEKYRASILLDPSNIKMLKEFLNGS